MVSNEVVMQTVKRMISSGIDDNTIRLTLKGINISDNEINSILATAKGSTGADEGEEPESDQPAAEEGGDFEEGEEEEPAEDGLDEQLRSASAEQSAQHATTHAMLDEHAAKIDDLHQNVSELHDKIDSSPRLSPETLAKLNVLDTRISALEKEVSETKANTIALKDILQKILETDRKTLLELKKK